MIRVVKQITGDHYYEMHAVDIFMNAKKAFESVNGEMLEQAAKAEKYQAASFHKSIAAYRWPRNLHMQQFTTEVGLTASCGVLAGATGALSPPWPRKLL